MNRFDSPPSYTNSIRGQCSIRIASTGGQKRAFTITLCIFAKGKKLPALIIFKERNGELGQRVRAATKCPENVRITASTNGWMTKEKLGLEGEAEDGEKCLLTLDHYKLH